MLIMHDFLYKYTSMIDACLKNQKKRKCGLSYTFRSAVQCEHLTAVLAMLSLQ